MQPEMKTLTFELKAFGDDDNGTFEAILSTPATDRDGETIAAGAFEPLPKSIPIHFAHDFINGAAPIGVGEPRYEGDMLMVRGRFAPTERAQEMRALVNGGFITSMSAGFLATKRKGKAILSGDLIEGSLTATPVNTQALILASKALNDGLMSVDEAREMELKAGARNSRTDGDRLQQIHDLSVENGASCSAMKSLKSIVGSVEALQDRVRDALEDAYGAWNTCLRGVLPDTVVFDWFGGDGDTYQQTYEDDGDVVTLTGTATEVDVHEIVVPDADADRETADAAPTMLALNVTDATGPADAAPPGPADAAPAAEDDDKERQRQRVRVWQIAAI